jgi:SpoVK/Ycf46/Vps4 family AAA+-type ATPase
LTDSISRGLSQKLAIRLGKHYPQSKLVEINAHSLGSKFFGESGKLVSKAFESIELLLEEEEDTFVCVFVDEIETLAARRESALSSKEPFDAVRAVNALLTGLDRLKQHHNVVVICTSNLVTALVSCNHAETCRGEFTEVRLGPGLPRSRRYEAVRTSFIQ